MEMAGFLIGAALTLMVWSYIFGDNFLFRLAENIFVGCAIGYAVAVAWHGVLVPTFNSLVAGQRYILTAVPLLLGFLLLLKVRPGGVLGTIGNVPVAFLVGVGAALAVGGALFGTFLPQVGAAISLSLNPHHYQETDWEEASKALLILLCTVSALSYFAFGRDPRRFLPGVRGGWIRFWSGMGRFVIMITLGVLFANTVMSRMALLIGRLDWLLEGFGKW